MTDIPQYDHETIYIHTYTHTAGVTVISHLLVIIDCNKSVTSPSVEPDYLITHKKGETRHEFTQAVLCSRRIDLLHTSF